MQPSAYDLKAFYNTRTGRVVRRIIKSRIVELWPHAHNLRVMGYGYAVPYLGQFFSKAERVFGCMPYGLGAHHWPYKNTDKNLICVTQDDQIPIETNSIDRIIMVHDLEYCDNVELHLAEIGRVLKSNGRVLMIVPNRNGLWSHADWSPFGQGRPFTTGQIYKTLHDNGFSHERTEEALFMPPIQWPPILKLANGFEKVGRVVPIAAGVHIVEASKQIYARADKGHGAKVKSKSPMPIIPKPAISRNMNRSH